MSATSTPDAGSPDIITDTLGRSAFASCSRGVLDFLRAHARVSELELDHRLLAEGNTADQFHLISDGRVVLEAIHPRGAHLLVTTLGPGDVVGVSWMLPPHRWAFDARTLEASRVVTLDAREIRRFCDERPELGYEILKAMSSVIAARLQAARLQLLDLHAPPEPVRPVTTRPPGVGASPT